jgi:hypothetical protein
MAINVTITPSANIAVKRKSNPRILINQSDSTFKNLGDLVDVDLTNLEDGSLLIYDILTQKFVASRLLEKQEIDGGEF